MLSDAVVVVLAAGRGSRAGGPKALRDVSGQPWLVRQLASLRAVGAARVVSVLSPAVRDALAAIDLGEVALNQEADSTPFASLHCGLRTVENTAGVGSVWVLPVDVPCPGPRLWRALSSGLRGDSALCVVQPTREGRGGHPVGLSAAYARELARRDPTLTRLDECIRAVPARAYRAIECRDELAFLNLNRAEDWAAFDP